MHALFISYVTTGDTFTIAMPLTVVLMAVLGGTRHWAGPIVGATAITLLLYAFTGGDSAIIGKGLTGLVLIVVILFMPEGLLGQALKWWQARRGAAARCRRRPPARRRRGARRHRGRSPRTGEVLLRARGVRKSFKGVQALRGVDLEVRRARSSACSGPTARASRPSSTSPAATTR